MKYRTRSINVQAVQWRGDNESQIGRIIGGGRCDVRCKTIKAEKGKKGKKGEEDTPETPERRVVVVKFDGKEVGKVEVGQWLVRGPQGEPGILDPDDFNRRFERS